MSKKQKILIDPAKVKVLKILQTVFGKAEIFWALSGSNAFNLWTQTDGECEDIDIRIDKIWVREKTPEFLDLMNSYGFKLTNLREMTFTKEVEILGKNHVVDVGFECKSFTKGSVEIIELEDVNIPVLSVKSLIENYEEAAASTWHPPEKLEKNRHKLYVLKGLL